MEIIKKNKLFILLLLIIGTVLGTIFFNKRGQLNKNKITETFTECDLDIVYGSDMATLTVYVYSSYNCFFCRKFFNETYPPFKEEYIDKNRVKLVVKLLELSKDEAIINSLKTAVCINKFGNFEMLNKLLLADPMVVYTKEFIEVMEEFIEKDSFVAECMINGSAEKYILGNALEFKRIGLKGTPTFIINNKIYKGCKNYNEFRIIIEKELSNCL